MKIINLVGWVGHHFDYPHGALINLPRDIAIPRREAGLVRDATAEEIESLELNVFPDFVDDEDAVAEDARQRQPRDKRK